MSEMGFRILDGVALSAGELADGIGWHKVGIEGRWDGHWMGSFSLTRPMFEQMVQHSQGKQVDTVVDYEHATLFFSKAPASGWIKALQVRDGSGGEAELWSRIAWTRPAADHIRDQEYRYLSPVFMWNTPDRKSGRLTGASLHSVALTNTPFLEELPEVRLNGLRAALMGGSATWKEKVMNEHIAALVAMLGLSADTTPETALSRVEELIKEGERRQVALGALYQHLGLGEEAGIEEAMARVAALQVYGLEMNGADTRVVELEGELLEERVSHLVERAQREGKITASKEQVDWFRGYAMKDIEGARTLLEQMPRQVPLTPVPRPSQSGGRQAAGQLTDYQLKVCKDLGLTPEQYLKRRDEQKHPFRTRPARD